MQNTRLKRTAFLLMILFSLHSYGLSCLLHAASQDTAVHKIEKPKFTIPLGEKMIFSIRWLGLQVGTAEVSVPEIVKIRERDAYHIQVLVRSNSILDFIWRVRDEHHSYVDVEHLHSLRYEKKLREGTYRADEFIDYDQVNHKARYESRRSGTVKEMLIPKDVQDALSCTFWFRVQPIKPGDRVYIPVNADEKNWNLEVEVHDIETLDLDGFGKVNAIRIEPLAKFNGLFVRKGRVWGWMSTDAKRLPLAMRTEIKIGSIYMVIKQHDPGKQLG